MKTLSLLRHAKSSWENSNLADIERPILEKGRNRTQRVCSYMKKHELFPDFIISSPATRAFQTAIIVIEELKLSLQPQINKEFYPGTVKGILDEIATFKNEFSHLLIIGHNPVFTDLIIGKAEEFTLDWLPTSGLVTLQFNISDWSNIKATKGICIHYANPKELKV